ncbi:BTB/POZ and MATH domain-containing protein 2-like isoform X2 [Carex littledalei]|uniref:BTB/POZ and MATH domain-containing protein 2-like isoform X2 n=1 Tax=Carex littledalei TaxID=544730 RepID=A0A833R6P5_9POAL|nr:BTB/POZ and MATH domain-containing protein 2-like isoform X2 [Carex littledalei]
MRKIKDIASVSINELVEGSHLFKVTGHSLLLERNCSIDYVQSTPFEVGGHKWAINFYPLYNDQAAVFVVQLSEGNGVRAKTHFDLLDQLGKPSGMTPHDDKLYMFVDILLEEIYDIDNIAHFLALAERYNCNMLKSACLDYLADPKILSLTMLTEEYLQLIIDFPSILKDIKENISHPILDNALSELENIAHECFIQVT